MIISELDWELFVLISALLGLLCAGIQSYLLLKIPVTEEKPLSIAKSIMEGSNAFMKRQHKSIFTFAIILAILIFIAFYFSEGLGNAWKVTLGFLVGAIGSAVSGIYWNEYLH
jgi:Inorganic pyrophosphatase